MPVSFSRSWMNRSNSCCLRVSISAPSDVAPGITGKTKPEQSLSVPVLFCNCLNFNECGKAAFILSDGKPDEAGRYVQPTRWRHKKLKSLPDDGRSGLPDRPVGSSGRPDGSQSSQPVSSGFLQRRSNRVRTGNPVARHSRPSAFRRSRQAQPPVYAVAPAKISKPVSMMFGVSGRSGFPRIASTAFSPIRNRFERTVDNGFGNSRPISRPLNPKIAS